MKATSTEACCTCAMLLSELELVYDPQTEKRLYDPEDNRRLSCCTRVICGKCISENSRFADYCPFCQIASSSKVLPPPKSAQARDNNDNACPPPYVEISPHQTLPDGAPPAYSESLQVNLLSASNLSSSSSTPAPDVIHHLNHNTDTLPGLSLRYKVPIDVLRRVNNLTADHLLLARKTVVIPGDFYKGGISLSPVPVEGEEEDERKTKIVRFQRSCRVAEYDIALLYLQQSAYDLDLAVEKYKDDESWERDHPLHAASKGKGKGKTQDVAKRRFLGR